MAKSDPAELARKIELAHEQVKVGRRYRHIRNGDVYRVLRIVLREEDTEPSVDYEAERGPCIPWNRKLNLFLERFHLEPE